MAKLLQSQVEHKKPVSHSCLSDVGKGWRFALLPAGVDGVGKRESQQ